MTAGEFILITSVNFVPCASMYSSLLPTYIVQMVMSFIYKATVMGYGLWLIQYKKFRGFRVCLAQAQMKPKIL